MAQNQPSLEIFILAGGLSSRMGRDKSRVRLGRRTMLEHVRAVAAQTGLRVRVVRRDAVPRCGPLGGIYTAFKRSRAEMILILACDMPFVSVELLNRMTKAFAPSARSSCPALFASESGRAGFPCLLRREPAFDVVDRQIRNGDYSLQALARELHAKIIRMPRSSVRQLTNINTPSELDKALHGCKVASLPGRPL